MVGDYISREYLLGEYDRQHQGPPGGARKIIAEAPAADVVEVVHARPVKFYNDAWSGRMITTCSACDTKIGPHDSFCKHCGAKMDGGQDE